MKPLIDGAYGVHPNIVDQARTIILAAIAKATPSPDDSGYLTQLHEDVKAARPAHMDTWLAMDAVIAALNTPSRLVSPPPARAKGMGV